MTVTQDIDTLAKYLLADALVKDVERAKQKAFHEALLASGLVSRIARRSEPDRTERRLIEVQGEPLSETIIRERR